MSVKSECDVSWFEDRCQVHYFIRVQSGDLILSSLL